MDTLLHDIIQYINLLQHDYNINCSFNYSFLPNEYFSQCLMSIRHTNPYCTLIKRFNLRKCNLAKEITILQNQQEIHYAKCYAGVEEYIFPVVLEGKVVNFISVSGYRSGQFDMPHFSKYSAGVLEPEELKAAYMELNTDIPDLSFLSVIVQPLVHMIKLLHISTPASSQTGTDYPPLYNEILDYLNNNYMNNITISDIQNHCHFSPTQIRKVFKKYSGSTINTYILNLKMSCAANLLKTTDLKINQIADRLGYTDSNYFMLQFKKYYGVTPSMYRRNTSES